jgi:hypothetical protein
MIPIVLPGRVEVAGNLDRNITTILRNTEKSHSELRSASHLSSSWENLKIRALLCRVRVIPPVRFWSIAVSFQSTKQR